MIHFIPAWHRPTSMGHNTLSDTSFIVMNMGTFDKYLSAAENSARQKRYSLLLYVCLLKSTEMSCF